MQSRQRDTRDAAGVPRCGRQSHLARRPVDRATRACRPWSHARRRQRTPVSGGDPRGRHFDVQPRHHLWGGGGKSRGLEDHTARRDVARTTSRLGLRTHGGGGDAARRRSVSPSRRRRPGRQIRGDRRGTRRTRSRELRDLELVTTRTRVSTQPPLLAPRELSRLRVCRPRTCRWPTMVERADPRSIHRDGGRRARTRVIVGNLE